MWEKGIKILSAIAGAVAGLYGGWSATLSILVAVMCIDYVTGVLVAAVWHKSSKTATGGVSSAAGFKGLLRKMVILLVVWLGAEMDKVLGIDYVRTAVCLFYVANEGLSVLENTAIMGVPYPKFVKDMLDALRKKTDEGEEEPEAVPVDKPVILPGNGEMDKGDENGI